MKMQGFTNWEILEEHTDGWLAGDREIELQKEYGYRVDSCNYMITVRNGRIGNTGGIPYMNSETAFRVASAGGKATRSITMELANEIRSKYVKKYGMVLKLAKEYNISNLIVSRIVTNKIYKNE